MTDRVESFKVAVDDNQVLSKQMILQRIVKIHKDYDEIFQENDLWETFRENFNDFDEKSFLLTNTQKLRKFRELLKKQNV